MVSINLGFNRTLYLVNRTLSLVPLLLHQFIIFARMKLLDMVLLSLAAGFMIIGIYEVMKLGLGQAYWALMLAFGLFFIYTYRKRK